MSSKPSAVVDKFTWESIAAAHARIAPRIHRTPVLRSATLDTMCGAELFFKCENLQKTGSFKIRGATNAIFSLTNSEAARMAAKLRSASREFPRVTRPRRAFEPKPERC